MKLVRLSASRTGRLYPREIFLVLIFTRGWVDPRAMVRSEGICHWKNPVAPPGIDSGTVRLKAQPLNHYTTPGPQDRRCFSKNSNWVHLEYSTQAQSTVSHCRLTRPTGEWLFTDTQKGLLWLVTKLHQGHATISRDIQNGWIFQTDLVDSNFYVTCSILQ